MSDLQKPRVRIGTDGNVRGVVAPADAATILQPRLSAGYFNAPGSGGGSALFGWRPSLREARDDVGEAYVDAAARAIDTLQNSGWISGAIDQSIAKTIGTELRLSAQPDRTVLGWTEQQTQEWINLVERRFIMWSERPTECDVHAQHTLGQLTASLLRSWFAYGEGLSLLPSVTRSISQSKVKVQLLPPHRLKMETNQLKRMHQGVIVDTYGMPIGYRIKRNGDNLSQDVDIAARDGVGRPQVIHVFQGAIGQVRGISLLAPVLRVVRQFDQLADATLTASMIQALFAATIESDLPTEEILRTLQSPAEQSSNELAPILNYFEAKATWYENTKIDMGVSGRVTHC